MIRYYNDIEQGGEEWLAVRRGIPTASEMRLILTPTMRPASNDKERAHLFELLGQRITGYTEPHYISDDMLRGHEDEIEARIRYAEHFYPVTECGFVTNDDHGVVIGYSPDGLVGDDGLIECKVAGRNTRSRRFFRRSACRVPAAVPDWIARHRAEMAGFHQLLRRDAHVRQARLAVPGNSAGHHRCSIGIRATPGGCSGQIRRMARPPAGHHQHRTNN